MITLPYLLVLNVPLHLHEGRYWADPLWKKDLEAHRVQIDDLSIACPVVRRTPPAGWQPLSEAGIVVHPLPAMTRFAALLAPMLAVRLWRATGRARIVHVGIAGWPFPLGWLAIPIARLRRRPLVLVVESAFWRIAPGIAASRVARARARVWESVNRRAVAACTVNFFTTQAYLDELHAGPGAAHVLPAVWIDETQLIDSAHRASIAPARRGRFLFAGRLTHAKGVGLLLEAVAASGVPVDFVGDGDSREAVLAAQRRYPHLVRLREPVDYGPAFTAMLDDYAALVVPTLTDEQPRVIFDAFARGLAVLASATPGNAQIVGHGQTGLLFATGDVGALTDALVAARADPDRIDAMGAAARADITGRTHAAMHAERASRIVAALPLDR